MNHIEKKWSDRGIQVLLADHENYIDLLLIKVPKEKQNKGFGTKIMNDIVKDADKQNKNITLIASECYGSSRPELFKFYNKFGFVKTRGALMERLPLAS